MSKEVRGAMLGRFYSKKKKMPWLNNQWYSSEAQNHKYLIDEAKPDRVTRLKTSKIIMGNFNTSLNN